MTKDLKLEIIRQGNNLILAKYLFERIIKMKGSVEDLRQSAKEALEILNAE